MNRRADAQLRKHAQERSVRATDSILSIDRGQRADHPFEHLIAELAFATRGIGALSGLAKSALHLPDSRSSDEQPGQQSNDIPSANRSRGRSLRGGVTFKDPILLYCCIANDFIEFRVHVAEFGKAFLRESI